MFKSDEIYRFSEPIDIVVHAFHEKTKRNPLFSIRAWSRQLGFKNPSYLADVLSKRRNLTVEFGLRISGFMDLNEDQRTYFESLIFYKNAKTPAEQAYFSNIIKKLKPEDKKKTISPDKHGLVKDWYYGVLDEMTCLGNFKPDPHDLSKRLGPEVTPQAVAVALADLVRLGSIEQGPKVESLHPKVC